MYQFEFVSVLSNVIFNALAFLTVLKENNFVLLHFSNTYKVYAHMCMYIYIFLFCLKYGEVLVTLISGFIMLNIEGLSRKTLFFPLYTSDEMWLEYSLNFVSKMKNRFLNGLEYGVNYFTLKFNNECKSCWKREIWQKKGMSLKGQSIVSQLLLLNMIVIVNITPVIITRYVCYLKHCDMLKMYKASFSWLQNS